MSNLAARIDAYCRTHGLAPSAFCRAAINDPSFYGWVRRGGVPGQKRLAKIESALAKPPTAKMQSDVARGPRTPQALAATARSVALMQATKARNEGEPEPHVPNNPKVPGLGGAFRLARGGVLLDVWSARCELDAVEARTLAYRILALTELAA